MLIFDHTQFKIADMKIDRRRFIKTSGFMAIGLSVIPKKVFGKKDTHNKFLSKIGICTGISNSQILASAGYAYIEEGVGGFLSPLKPEEIFNEKLSLLKNSDIPVEACNSFLPGDLKCVGPETHHEQILQYVEIAFRRAELAGIKTIVFGSSGSRNIPEGFDREEAKLQFISICKKMAPLAEKFNVVVSLEPLNRKECNFINSVIEGGEIVMSVNHPNFRLLADIYHMLVEDEGAESIIKCGHLLHHVHIAEKEGRTAPGIHGEDFTAYFKALKAVNYKGRLSIECRWDNIEEQAKNSLLTLRNQIESLNA